MDNSTIWKLIDKYFQDNPQSLVRHHTESYNDFFKNGIFQIFKDNNPLRIKTNFDEKTKEYRSQCIMYFGGKEGNKIYFGKPVIYDDNNSHYMFPNEARLRNMTYGMTIHYDIDAVLFVLFGRYHYESTLNKYKDKQLLQLELFASLKNFGNKK